MGYQKAGSVNEIGRVYPRKTESHRMVRLEELRGEPYYIVYNTKSFRYIRLDESYYGAFNRMDGTKSMRAIIEDSFDESNRPDPRTIEEFIKLLVQTEMIRPLGLGFPEDSGRIEKGTRGGGRIKKFFNLILQSKILFNNIDHYITRLHRTLDNDAIKWPIIASAVVLYGAALASIILNPIQLFQQFKAILKPVTFNPVSVVIIFILMILSGILHEIAHAVTCKNFGCRIHSMGIKIYLGIPGFFTDTTDACTLTKWQRVVIDAAGTVVNIFLGVSLIGISIYLHEAAATVLLTVGAMNMITACYNLIPFVEYDGYYILSDLIDVPDLRATALRHILGKQYWRNMISQKQVFGIDGIMAAYGLCLIGFRLLIAVVFISAVGLFIVGGPRSAFRITIAISLLVLIALRIRATMSKGKREANKR